MKKKKFLDNKKNAQSVHFKKRMIERYNIYFNNADKRQMIKDVQCNNKEVEFLYKQSNTKTVWRILIQNKNIPIVYDNKRQNLVTCLTWKMVNENLLEMSNSMSNDFYDQ